MGSNLPLTVVILTRDEELHIGRALASVRAFASACLVVDSGSVDRTCEIARELGAEVLVHPFVNQAQQFNWALQQLPAQTGWVMRLDADEVVSPALAEEISEKLVHLDDDVGGVSIGRRMAFLRKPIRWGGVFPIHVVRIMRFGRGHCEDRWMDEHMVVAGRIVAFGGEVLDDNLKPLTTWVAKHNDYASREALEMLDLEFGVLGRAPRERAPAGNQAATKRWLKESLYARLPGGMRAFVYFLYRFVVRLGFLDGYEGAAFHLLQGFWYRYLVDLKVTEVRRYMARERVDATAAAEAVLRIRLAQ